ncbi:uncharacterized protein EI97DRAFT_310565 [Westerdykella ornata]|uniref:DNA replication checkpoint mediator MRC1 domain-containing protein n=1 Tax=Westerdykella ornata TaxID=318751 RepID=A0A6A6JKL4_WESOR|nr:uncharacterized protein EI97DRAFT_310565 [Westerdykella ornata]KAF2277131.1 hypothetical protein EI97DRAFT_310565 [Westerdykella ornata]
MTGSTPPINALSRLVESASESEVDDAPVQVPRRKLLAGLRPTAVHEDSESEDDGNAYERVKKMLMANTSNTESRVEHSDATNFSPQPENSEEEEDMPAQANRRRRISRKAPTSSPPESPRSTRFRSSSPGLFVTPQPSPSTRRSKTPLSPAAETDSDAEPTVTKDLEERVRRIRAERVAAQAKERRKAARWNNAKENSSAGSESDSDGENGRRLTQQARPTRKAGKKAMEDIAREQQRIKRNMQLTHQAKTKKKYALKDLLPKFGLAQVESELVPASAMPTPAASSVMASSDAEADPAHDTPATSPERGQNGTMKADHMERSASANQQPKLPSEPGSPAASPPGQLDKGKGRAPEFAHVPVNPLVLQSQQLQQNAQRRSKSPLRAALVQLSDSDDDLVIQPPSRFPVFDKLPQKKQREPTSMLHLRHLAHLTSPGKKVPKGQKSMSMSELQSRLARKAREQAQRERQEKIEDLRRRGIRIETEEERERQQLEIEDLAAQLEKARERELKLAKREREEAKKNGEKADDLLSSDESGDEDYVGSEEEQVGLPEGQEEAADLELSGSEEEEESEEVDEDDVQDEMQQETNELLDDAADEAVEEEAGEANIEGSHVIQADDDEDVDEVPQARAGYRAAGRSRNVIVDDDEQSDDEAQSKPSATPVPALPTQTQTDDIMAAFGFANAGDGPGLTQMFAGTMAALETGAQHAHPLDKEPEQDSLDFLRSLPDTQPGDVAGSISDMLVPNSQGAETQQLESQFSLGISQVLKSTPALMQTQQSDTFEPTQDAGFELSRSPAGLAAPHSTVETVLMGGPDSPNLKKKGRLHQRKPAAMTELSDVEEPEGAANSGAENGVPETEEASNAFKVPAKGAKKQKKREDKFNKKTSWARDAVEEQAEESEDEYAGLGGASDDDSGEEDEELAKMIDTNDVKVDERKLAAYFAEKTKADDEKNINQLYKDLMNGGLRKRRSGDGFDMSDSEDEAEQRRRKKRQDFQKMTRALLADERVGKIAQNPKQQAFFHTMADHFEDPEYEFLDAPELDVNAETAQSQSDKDQADAEDADITIPDSQTAETPAPMNPLKRKALPNSQDDKENRPPPHLRRTARTEGIARKPMTLAGVQHSVAELLEDPHIVVPDSQLTDSEPEVEVEVARPASRKPIIDRLNMSRAAASVTTKTVAEGLAFVAPSAGAVPGFRVPALVRRATNNSNISGMSVSTSSSGRSTPLEGSGVRRGGTGRSNIHAQAREAERRAALEKVERKRKEELKMKVQRKRGEGSVLKALDGGFE